MSQADLVQTPGYQFNLAQGLKATQNAAAARGLGSSGAALKGAAAYATGLADNTYKTQFDMENINRTNAFNRLMSISNQGANAAAQTGQAATQTGANVGNSLISQGNAQAAGYLGAAGALNGGVQNYLGLNYMNNLASRGGMYGAQDPWSGMR
jgi:hypothetical protein